MELFDVVDQNGNFLRQATRKECHGNPELIHQVAHILVFDADNSLWMQKRSPDKDIQPGKWDTSVGGHLMPGEHPVTGAVRETAEEIGITVSEDDLTFCYQYIMSNEIETELVHTYYFKLREGDSINFDSKEISEGRFWTAREIQKAVGTDIFTPNFEDEWRRFTIWRRDHDI
ncbi:MAG: NUDIX domain-containing protein [Candidatus Auribacter fodinae]|jgi:isopentenyldiphosphate isomerase|uniref:NUDIX domain-containing protein n=1 Tax=Candidatus Auribacter fodinae TaxID=2093366 RepID=A0A3A4R4Z5_9BACT|nr:MAG: NUDIX domain-containing protein [Candidatus Auribacter fodinae]